jgi:hypothetical protein
LVSDIKGKNIDKGFENKVLRTIFGPKTNEIIGLWRKLHNEELYNLYPLQNIITIME